MVSIKLRGLTATEITKQQHKVEVVCLFKMDSCKPGCVLMFHLGQDDGMTQIYDYKFVRFLMCQTVHVNTSGCVYPLLLLSRCSRYNGDV